MPTNNTPSHRVSRDRTERVILGCRVSATKTEKIKMHRMDAGDCEALLALACDARRLLSSASMRWP